MTPFHVYLTNIEKALQAGNATEHTYRPALKALVESMAEGITATNEPKREACGAPDYIVTRGQTPLGYIEAKDVGKPLDEIERGEQMGRYVESLGNLILTDYLEFRWYVAGEHRLTARLAKVGAKGKVRAEKDGAEQVAELLTSFLSVQVPTVGSPKELAGRMAALARLIRDTIRRAFEDEDGGGSLHQQMEGFRKVLLHDLTREQFADMYAQTICYGLFAARCNATGAGPFTREHAAFALPKTNPFLRKMFGHIAGPDLDERVVWAVDDLAELLNRADMAAILQDFGKRTRREDPVVHFYETFLAAYDPKMREARGVYYTPEPVVSYIVRSIDHILKTDFGLPDGLANTSTVKIPKPHGKGTIDVHKVLILDPATGTGTFLHGVIDQIYESFKGNKGMWSGYVSQHLLPRLFGFELLMAPYAVAHMKLGLQLAETGYDFKADERLRVYLTNTLEEAHEMSDLPLFTQWLAEEAHAAGQVKQEAPVMVVLGNPPYSGISVNMSDNIAKMVDAYKVVDGKPLGERKHWLQDDYVKFIRFSQCRIEQTGYGVLAFICNHGYLDNPTFRGMRQSLMETFDDIYVLDLHGNSKKKERCPDGSKDENVFDIQQGVAIGIFVKRLSAKKKAATVRHAHLWGVREVYEKNAQDERVLSAGKYHWLWGNELATITWTTLKPQSPFYLFVPQDTEFRGEYERGYKVTDIFPVNSTGIVSARDSFVIDFDAEPLLKRIEDLRSVSFSDEELRTKYFQGRTPGRYPPGDSRGWKLPTARSRVRADQNWRHRLADCLYRPFDVRRMYYVPWMVDWPRPEVLPHMLAGENLGLIATRQTRDEWHVLVTNLIMGHKSMAAFDINSIFPLYLYPATSKDSLFNIDAPTDIPPGRRPNLAPEFIADFAGRLKMTFIPDGKGDRQKTFGPEDVFDYMYAIFHAPTYRSRYAEFLKIDFPRLPLTSNPDLFRALCALGGELVGLHLMKKYGPMITGYPVAGDNLVEKVRYTEPSPDASRHPLPAGEGRGEGGRVWINKTQYFEGVPPEVWNFHVGGYQVCEKWLKDRKGRQLTYDDLTHYQQVVSALSETIRLMARIDTAIEEHGGWPIRVPEPAGLYHVRTL